uniref:Uncharacterized protein n=1 Tax=Timema bartmani TaxID=61472 RepID=A0A7R9I7P1_9NEOP|nr:unnamed protein product [Timema bartmani]
MSAAKNIYRFLTIFAGDFQILRWWALLFAPKGVLHPGLLLRLFQPSWVPPSSCTTPSQPLQHRSLEPLSAGPIDGARTCFISLAITLIFELYGASDIWSNAGRDLLAAHALFGCDTVPALYGISKKKVMKALPGEKTLEKLDKTLSLLPEVI